MKMISPSILVVLLAAAPAVLGAATFEGKVHLKISDNKGQSHEMVQSLKDGLVRTDVEAGVHSASLIMDFAKQELTILIAAQHMYMVRPMPTGAPAGAPGAADTGEASFAKTGETEKILGYDCVKYVAKTKDGAHEVWVTDQLGRFGGLGGGNPMARRHGGKPTAGWEQLLAGKDLFPLRVVTHNAAGTETFRLEAVSVEKTTLPASDFQPPADYKKLDMGGMMPGTMPGH